MRHALRLRQAALAVSALALVMVAGAPADYAQSGAQSVPAGTKVTEPGLDQVVAMRRLSETQYRHTIADIFGPDILISGRFEPVVRVRNELIASGARDSSISPAGLEQFDAMARGIAEQVFDEKHRGQFMSCAPRDEKLADADCTRAVLAPLGRYLFRRPLTADELAMYAGIANDGAQPTHSYYDGLKLGLAAMMISPNFLYVVERAEPDPDHRGQMRLDNYSRAARLSFVLWDSTPNDTLLNDAQQGLLTRQDKLDAIAAEMVQSPRFEYGVRAFFADMLVFESFDDLSKDQIVYPYYNPEVAQALPEQTLRTIVDALVTHNDDYRELFKTRRTFMTRVLGALYQVPVHHDKGWEPYTFPASSDRAGLLGQAGFLAIYSHEGRSSPTLRGRAIRELLVCEPVPNPPPNVNFTAVQDVHNMARPTARDRLAAHATDPSCAACHKFIDPIGLSLERFDGIGAFRATENGALIDATGVMDGKTFKGATGLGQVLASGNDATNCVASRALEYATARTSDEVSKQVAGLQKNFAAEGYRLRALFKDVATMPEAYTIPMRQASADPAPTGLAANSAK
jgi:hypothetical protein